MRHQGWAIALLWGLAACATAQTAPFYRGPGPSGAPVHATGTVIGIQPGQWLVQIDAPNQVGLGGGGRLWWRTAQSSALNAPVRLDGLVVDTQMTRLGPRWVPMPVGAGRP